MKQAMKKGLMSLATLLMLAACSPVDQKPGTAQEISKETVCELDGMTLADYPGPKGQIQYADGKTDFFCDPLELLSMLLRPEQQRKVLIAYVNDMSKADWDAPRGSWIDASKAFYVKGSRKHAAMGPTFVPFSDEAAAKAFAAKEGGEVIPFAKVTADMVSMDGGVLRDSASH